MIVLGRLWLFKKQSISIDFVAISISIFFAPIISDGRMYRRRDVCSLYRHDLRGHNGQLRQRGSAWTDVIVVQLASWVVNYSGRAAATERLEQGLGGWERHPTDTHVRSLTDAASIWRGLSYAMMSRGALWSAYHWKLEWRKPRPPATLATLTRPRPQGRRRSSWCRARRWSAQQHVWLLWHRPGTQVEICLPRNLHKNSKIIYSAASTSEDIFFYLALYK